MRFGIQTLKMENSILLWDHLAEIVLAFSLKMPVPMKLYFGNLYDEKEVSLDVEEFDATLSEMIESMIEEVKPGNLILSYSFDDKENLIVKITKQNGKSSSF